MKPDATLTNTYWKLVELDGAAVRFGEDRELHMILKGDNQVRGYAGCNQFTGSATVTGDALSFGPIASTRRMCPDVMQQEDEFVSKCIEGLLLGFGTLTAAAGLYLRRRKAA